jgi:hypothetical protein
MLLDRLVASVAAMAAALYLMAGSLAWYRFFRPRETSLPHVRSVILDRALAWSSLAVIFYTIVAIKMGWYHWSDDYVDAVRVVALSTIFGCGLISIRAITARHFGYSVVGWFAAVSIAVGLLILLG